MKDAVVSIGAGASQLGLIEAIRARGLCAVGVDRDPAAPGLARCSAFVRVSTHDSDAVIAGLRALPGYRIRGVLAQSSGAPAVSAARAAAALGLAGVEPRRAELAASKEGFAELCREAGVRTPETCVLRDPHGLAELPLPLVLKPSRGRVGKQGVVCVRERGELAHAFARAQAASADGVVVAQELIAGRDVSTLALFRAGVVRILTTLDERVAFAPAARGAEACGLGVDVPSALAGTPAAAALGSATQALACRLGTGVGFFAFRVPASGEPAAIEAHLDLAGDYVCDVLLARGAGLDLAGLALELALTGRLPEATRAPMPARLSFLYEGDRSRLAELALRGEVRVDAAQSGGGRIGYLLERWATT
jgi:biotin carboxylase